MSHQLSTNEALLAFASWLSTRPGTLEVGEHHESAEVCALYSEFVEWNDVDEEEEPLLHVCHFPPTLWYRNTPSLGAIEWSIRKGYKNLCLAVTQLFGDVHTCP